MTLPEVVLWQELWRGKLKRLHATRPNAMDLPGLRFHHLKGGERGRYAIWVSENWRLTFAWDGADAINVDLEDYH